MFETEGDWRERRKVEEVVGILKFNTFWSSLLLLFSSSISIHPSIGLVENFFEFVDHAFYPCIYIYPPISSLVGK